MLYNLATTRETLELLCKKVFEPSKRGIDNILISLPCLGQISLIKFLINFRSIPRKCSKILADYLGKQNVEKSVFLIFDTENYDQENYHKFYKEINLQLSQHNIPKSIINNKSKEEDEYVKFLDKCMMLLNKSFTIYIITRYAKTTNDIDKRLLKEILKIQSLNRSKIRLIFSVYRDTHTSVCNEIKSKSVYTLTYIPLLTKNDIEYQIKKYFFEYNLGTPRQELIDFVSYHSGGLGGLIKPILIENLSKEDPKKYKVPLNVNTIVKEILEVLTGDEIEYLKELSNNKKPTIQIDKKYITNTGLINSPGLIEKIIKNTLDLQDEKKDTIELPIEITNNLTPTQYRIFKLLSAKKGEIVSRDEIAEEIWLEKVREKYSDWAIDRHIYKLRRLLAKHVNIITKKGRGFYMTEQKK